MTEAERMKLALAMGLDPDEQVITYSAGNVPAFDPEHDANDDYAVLEWMRDNYEVDEIEAAFDHDGFGHRWVYEKGLYARAALILINGDMDKCEDCSALQEQT